MTGRRFAAPVSFDVRSNEMKIMHTSLLLGLLLVLSGCASTQPIKRVAYDKSKLEVWSGTVVDASAQQGPRAGSVVLSPARLVTPTDDLTLLAKTINAELPRSPADSNLFIRVEFIFLDGPAQLPKRGESCRIEGTTEIDGAKWLRNVTIME